MDLDNFNLEYLQSLDEDERKEFIHEFLQNKAATTMAAFINPSTGQAVKVEDLVKEIGEDKVVEMISKAVDDTDAESKTLGKEDIEELLKKAAKNQCSDSELAMLNFLKDQSSHGDSMEFQHTWLEMSANLIDFGQNAIKYNVKLSDLLSSALLLFTASETLRKDSSLNKYNINKDARLLIEMGDQVADSIYSTWADSCKKKPATEVIVMGLLHLANKLALDADINFCDILKLEDILNIEFGRFFDEEELEENYDLDTEYENGSNSKKDFRDLLKD
jgi:hypothetical protein